MQQKPVTFGIRLPVAGPLSDSDAIRTVTSTCIVAGYDALWVHDFIIWNRHLDRYHVSCGSHEAVEAGSGRPTFHESLTTLSYVAGITQGSPIKIGMAVLCLPYRHPVVAGRQVASLDVLSGGRLILGVGVGAPADRGTQDFEVLGIPRREKYDRATEYLRAMRDMWTSDVTTYEGTFVRIPGLEFYPKPLQKPHPPIWFGGWGDKTMAMLAEHGTGWLPGVHLPEEYPPKIEQIRRLASERGRPDLDLTVGLEVTACIAETDEKAQDHSRKTLEGMTVGYPVGSKKVFESAMVGSPATIRRRVAEYMAVGVSHFEIKFVYHTIPHFIEQLSLFSVTVIPEFRDGRRPLA